MERHDLGRGILIGVLLMMVIRSVVWLATPWEHPDATQARDLLNIANVAICGLAAWATWWPQTRLEAKLQRLFTQIRRN